MKVHKLWLLVLGACVAGAAFGQDKPDVAREQANQSKASAALKQRAANPAHTAAGTKDKQQDAQARYERAEKVAGSIQKKANDTANSAASNVK